MGRRSTFPYLVEGSWGLWHGSEGDEKREGGSYALNYRVA